MPLPIAFGLGAGLAKTLVPLIVEPILDHLITVLEELVEKTDNPVDDQVVAVFKSVKSILVKEILGRL